MKRFSWTTETSFRGYALRGEDGLARAVVTRNFAGMFYGQVFVAGLPGDGPFTSAALAAGWVHRKFAALQGLDPKECEFGAIPNGAR